MAIDFEQTIKEHGLELDNSYRDENYRWLAWDKDLGLWVVCQLCDYVDDVVYSGPDIEQALRVLIGD